MRENKVIAALRAAGDGGADLEGLIGTAYDDTPDALWPIARLSLESHLLELERKGRATRSESMWRLT
jgi:hypothetical protein